jgi:nicotinate-nucleotide adenylyltransferase
VLGGTFDPVHLGHVASATQVAEALALDTVLLVLSARPPHKPSHRPAAIEDRWAMLEIAATGHGALEPSGIEIEREGPSFTVDTLAALHARQPAAELFLIVGIDAYREVDTWHHPERLLALANLVVTTRPGYETSQNDVLPPVAGRQDCGYDPLIGRQKHKSGHQLLVHRLDGLDVSSTEIRRRARAGHDVSALTGAGVAAYIRAHRLYQGTDS